jgi:transcriptional regulator with XRE-family HTH domain
LQIRNGDELMDKDFKNFAERMKQARKPEGGSNEAKPYDFAESYRLRSKMLGVLINDARNDALRSIEDCASLLNIEPQTFQSWEFGDQVPTLPQLELLAYYLDVPVSHFWGRKTLESDRTEKVSAQSEYLALRDRMIGAMLRQAREAHKVTVEAASEESGIPVETIQQYELGALSIPMHELSVLSNTVNKNMDYFLESSSYVGELLRIREEWKHFSDLEPDVREFAANPLNIGFIKIAITFSQMPVDQLRKAAEGMLEIAM